MEIPEVDIPDGVIRHIVKEVDESGQPAHRTQFGLSHLYIGNVGIPGGREIEPVTILQFLNDVRVYIDRQNLTVSEINEILGLTQEAIKYFIIHNGVPEAVKSIEDIMNSLRAIFAEDDVNFWLIKTARITLDELRKVRESMIIPILERLLALGCRYFESGTTWHDLKVVVDDSLRALKAK